MDLVHSMGCGMAEKKFSICLSECVPIKAVLEAEGFGVQLQGETRTGRSVTLHPGDTHGWGCSRTAGDGEGEACARNMQKGT